MSWSHKIVNDADILEMRMLGFIIRLAPKEDPVSKFLWPDNLSLKGFLEEYPEFPSASVYRMGRRLEDLGLIVKAGKFKRKSSRPYNTLLPTEKGRKIYEIKSRYIRELEEAGFISLHRPKTHQLASRQVGQGGGGRPGDIAERDPSAVSGPTPKEESDGRRITIRREIQT